MDNITIISEYLEKSREILLDSSRELMSSGNGDFRRAEVCFELAKRVEVLRRDVREAFSNVTQSPIDVGNEGTNEVAVKITSGIRRPPKKNKHEYPKYVTRNGSLVKIGLSRDERSVYEHTVDRINLDRILSRISTFVNANEFTVPEVMENISDIPDYQVYVVVALLKERGVLKTPRKGVYGFTSATQGYLSANDLAVEKG